MPGRRATLIVVLGTLGAASGQGSGGSVPEGPRRLAPHDKTPGLPRAVMDRAEKLARSAARKLAALQNEDGSFNLGRAKNPAPIAVTALASLALLSIGDIPGRTARGRTIEQAIRYLIAHQDRSKGPRHGYFSVEGDEFSKMHGQGYATLALAQVLGMLRADDSAVVTQQEAHTALEAAVRLIEKCQDDATGGWYYDPVAHGHEGSMTICMVQALRAAKNAGMRVDAKVIAKAIRYVERSQKRDGSFRYMLGDEKSSVALTAAAVMTLNATGQHGSPILRKGLSYLTDGTRLFGRRLRHRIVSSRFPYYERLYVGEALFTARDQTAFLRWFKRLVPDLENQLDTESGLWLSPDYGNAYATAMTVLVLALPMQFLPIHQR